MRVSQGLEILRVKALNPITIQGFYSNLLKLNNTYAYTPSHIWNVDESGHNTSKNKLGKERKAQGMYMLKFQIRRND